MLTRAGHCCELQRMSRPPDDVVAKQVTMSLLAMGVGTPGEIAEFAGVTRQVVENWARRAGIDWRRIKRAKLARAWRKEMARVPIAERRRAKRARIQKRVARARRRRDSELARPDHAPADHG